ncbi:hypothetical protein WJX75_003594 [Coccomyxa subellipsoidea]|uniref:6-phosphogluconate dehydrogenase NADP-binding domain-containing protein n=1 Tax=Coccomyxa subellipsoidea TaxID=248742 RepID=A0ABR2YXR4_9CHLO
MGDKEVVGFAGLGNMGTSMATNLLDFLCKASPEDPFEPKLHVYNRTQSKADKLVSQGALLAPSVADLASNCTIIFSMLLNDEAVGLLVSAGNPAARTRVKPLLEAIGQGILDCGDDARAGSAMKLVGNFFISSWIELAAEGMTLGEKNGVARETVLDFITKLFPGFITTGYAKALVTDKFLPTAEDPGFNLLGGMKDAGHMQRLGRESGAPLPVTDVVLQHMQQAHL